MIKVIETDRDNKALLDIDGTEVFILQKANGAISLSIDDGFLYILPKGENCIEFNAKKERIK